MRGQRTRARCSEVRAAGRQRIGDVDERKLGTRREVFTQTRACAEARTSLLPDTTMGQAPRWPGRLGLGRRIERRSSK